MRIYRWLLRCFPPAFRARFADDMQAVFRDRVSAARQTGWRALSRLYVATVFDVVAHGLGERRRGRALAISQGASPMNALRHDLRDGWRFVARRPGFAGLVVLTLGLGIGANTALFSVTKSVVLAPLPYRAPADLVMIWRPAGGTAMTMLSRREILSYREQSSSLAQLSTYADTPLNLTGDLEPERVRAGMVTPDLFATLGVPSAHGRTFNADDATPGAPADVIILGDGLWQRRFGGDATIVGRTIQVNGQARIVVGIMPPSFQLPMDYRAGRPTEAWIPLAIDPANPGQWGDRSYYGVARLRSGTTPATATAELRVIADRWIQAGEMGDPGDGQLHRTALPLQEFVTGDVRGPILILLGAVGFVLLTACANVVNLLLAQADARRRDVVVRTALGAGRLRLVRQFLVESSVLSIAGGLCGVGIAALGLQLLQTLRPALVPRVDHAGIDVVVLAFTAALSMATAGIFGMVPALHLSRPNLEGMLRDGGRGSGPALGRRALRRVLVVGQFAGAVVLVIGAVLLVRTLVSLYGADLGFDRHNVLTAQIQVPQAAYPQSSDVVSFYRRLLDRAAAIPGVSAAGAIRLLPLTRSIGNWSITVEGVPRTPGENPNGDFQWVTPGYFTAMATPLRRGRFITDADREDAEPVVLVNETMAGRYWPGQDALGKRFKMGTGDTPWMTIVGILGGTHHNGFRETPRAEMYLPHAQLPRTIGGAARAMGLVLKTTVEPSTIVTPLRAIVREIDATLPIAEIRTMDQIAAESLSETRFAMMLLAFFAALALILATIGVYGTISLVVTERVTEIGVRMALGATRASIVRLVLRQGVALTSIGIAIGVVAALFLTRFLQTLVYGVSTLDPLTYAAVPAMLAIVAVVACLRPARRAAKVDPIVTLKS